MATYQIISSAGVDMGTYDGATPRAAIEAMWSDAGWEPTADDIRQLQSEAEDVGDKRMALTCERALRGVPGCWESAAYTIRSARAQELLVERVIG